MQFRHLIEIPSRRFMSHATCHMALQAKHSVLGLTGKELNEAYRPGTTTVCSYFLTVTAQSLNLSNPWGMQSNCTATATLCCPWGLALFLCGKASLEVKWGQIKGRSQHTQNFLPLSDLSLCRTQSWGGKLFLFLLFSLTLKSHFTLALQWVALGPHYNWAWTIDSGCRQ